MTRIWTIVVFISFAVFAEAQDSSYHRFVELVDSSIQARNFSQVFDYLKLAKEDRSENDRGSLDNFDFSIFQKSLSQQDLVINYEFLDSNLFAFVIDDHSLEYFLIDSLQNVEEKVLRFMNLVTDPKSDLNLINSTAGKLQQYLMPFSIGPEIRNLVIAPDQILNYLSFDLLRYKDVYLIELYAISSTSSLALLENTLTDNKINSAALFVTSYENYTLSSQQLAMRGDAYNLEGALLEAESIGKIITFDKIVKEKASRARFLEDAGDYDLLHISLHSFLNDEDPELSNLVFHDGEEENELFISELYSLDLNASLAVLSACNSGVGQDKTGDGIVSMTRAFTYAGVPSVVFSLWSAPDLATKVLMTNFYSELKNGENKAQALRLAKQKYLEEQDVEAFKHPFYWAGFVVHGNTEPLQFVGISLLGQIGYAALASILLLGVMIGISALKNGGINQEI